MSTSVELLSWVFILLGSFLLLTGSLGLIRLPDFWSRLHAASISDTGGVLFLILGMMLHVTTIWVFFKLLAIAIFIFISSPTASHAIATVSRNSSSVSNSFIFLVVEATTVIVISTLSESMFGCTLRSILTM